MKKKFTNVLMVFTLVFSVLTAWMPTAQADPYEENLWGDDNYILIYGHMGMASYLDKSSVVVKQNDKNTRVFVQNVIIFNADKGKIVATKTRWYYQAINRDKYYEAFTSEDGQKWESFYLNNTVGAMQGLISGFKKGWLVAFGYDWS